MKLVFSSTNYRNNFNSTNFCRKPCKLGYAKDENNCFKCQCLEDTLSNSNLAKDIDVKPDVETNEDLCRSLKCKLNEICKNFNKTLYQCPNDQVDCKKFEKSKVFPLCIPNGLNGILIYDIKSDLNYSSKIKNNVIYC